MKGAVKPKTTGKGKEEEESVGRFKNGNTINIKLKK